MNEHLQFVLLPYLKTSGPVRFRNIVFRSTDDSTGLNPDESSHLKTLASMFFLKDDLRIKNMTYAIVKGTTTADIQTALQSITDFQTVVTYYYATPHHIFGNPFLTLEHASTYTFEPSSVAHSLARPMFHVEATEDDECEPEESQPDFVPGYEALLDMRSTFWVTAQSRIYPPAPSMWLNISQDLHSDIETRTRQSPYADLLYLLESNACDAALCSRLLTSLRWHNRSIAIDAPADVAMLCLSIAFETLLGLPRASQVTDRFKEAVALLLGPVPRLDSFLTQFYDARSEIVHEGNASDLMFRATDSTQRKDRSSASRYRPLASYARHIFRACLLTITRGGLAASQMKLQPMLTTNEQRCTEICRLLSNQGIPPGRRLASASTLISDFEMYRFVAEEHLSPGKLLGACKLAAEDYLASSPSISGDIEEKVGQLRNATSGDDNWPGLVALHQCVATLEAAAHEPTAQEDELRRLLLALLQACWGYTFPEYFRVKKLRGE